MIYPLMRTKAHWHQTPALAIPLMITARFRKSQRKKGEVKTKK